MAERWFPRHWLGRKDASHEHLVMGKDDFHFECLNTSSEMTSFECISFVVL